MLQRVNGLTLSGRKAPMSWGPHIQKQETEQLYFFLNSTASIITHIPYQPRSKIVRH